MIMASIGAVVVTYNSQAHIVKTIHSLWGNGVSDIFVIDNNSSDSTVKILNRLGVSCIRNPGNYGFGLSSNFGSFYANNPYLLFLNPDARLDSFALSRALNHLTANDSCAGVGLTLRNHKGQPEPFSFGSPVNPATFIFRRLPFKKIGWVSAGALLIRRSVFCDITGFDPRFFLYWEDVDLGTRLLNHGWSLSRADNASVSHIRGASFVDNQSKTLFYDISADKYFRKHYAAPIWLLYRWLRRFYRYSSSQAR